MTVSKILLEKEKNTFIISANQPLSEAITLLAQYRIGAIVVAGNENSIQGILSERDIIRAVSKKGSEALLEPVSSYMTQNVTVATPEMTITKVMQLMTNGKFRHLPVVRGGKFDGMISIGDVVKHRLIELENESQSLRDYIHSS